jgi:hypothetical protein
LSAKSCFAKFGARALGLAAGRPQFVVWNVLLRLLGPILQPQTAGSRVLPLLGWLAAVGGMRNAPSLARYENTTVLPLKL